MNIQLLAALLGLLLVDENPLKDVANVARRAGVMVRGRWLPESELRGMLDQLAAARRPQQ